MIEYLFLAILVLVMYAVSTWASGRENFESGESITLEEPEKIYDAEYAGIYNALWNSSKELMDFVNVSFQDIMLADKQTNSVNVLDMCCGTAPHACFFKNLGVEYTGVDISSDMLAKAYPTIYRRICLQKRVLDVLEVSFRKVM